MLTPQEELARFCETYLTRWEARANVRQRDRYHLAEGERPIEEVFPLAPEANDSLRGLDALKPGLGRFVHAQLQYRFLNDGATVETDVIGPIVTQIAHRPGRRGLPDSARQAALTIAVDEAYHAFVAHEFRLAAERATGIAPVGLRETSASVDALATCRGEVPEALRPEFDLIAISLLENVVTRELVSLREGQAPESGALRVIAEHLDDEGKHATFFVHLLRTVWATLSEAERAALAPGIGSFCHAYLDDAGRSMQPWFRAVLDASGLPAAQASALSAGVSAAAAQTVGKMWSNLRAALRQCGLLDHPSLGARFAEKSSLTPL